MERGIDLIVWAVLFLLLFGGSLIKAFLRWRVDKREEAKKPVTERKPHTFMKELKKTLEGIMVEKGGPEIITEEEEEEEEEEEPHRVRIRRVRMEEEEEEPLPSAPEPARPVGRIKRARLAPLSEIHEPKERHRKVPLSEILPKDELKKAIIMSEVLGPPRAKRRSYRLF